MITLPKLADAVAVRIVPIEGVAQTPESQVEHGRYLARRYLGLSADRYYDSKLVSPGKQADYNAYVDDAIRSQVRALLSLHGVHR